ncbi:ComEC/Rec2 family competence protein [Vibrio tapetis]|nr:MBL fold metallo-hydrolase [Vibrio tapetis]
MNKIFITYLATFLLSALSFRSFAMVDIRVVDVGPGLCVLATDTVNDKHVLYDAGRWTNSYCYDYVVDKVERDISLVVISHLDSDHFSNLPDILEQKKAELIVHTGYKRRKTTWHAANHAIAMGAKRGSTVINLQSTSLDMMVSPIVIGDMTIDFVYGLGEWDVNKGRLSESHLRNALSIVVRLSAHGKEVLLAGDTVGRHDGDPQDSCLYAEQDMVTAVTRDKLEADVLIAPHHGADNASSSCFLEAVSPTYVIYSAGHSYKHPREVTARRTLTTLGIPQTNMFRTDRGDDEGDLEWDFQRIPGCSDQAGDDDVAIELSATSLHVSYVNPLNECG